MGCLFHASTHVSCITSILSFKPPGSHPGKGQLPTVAQAQTWEVLLVLLVPLPHTSHPLRQQFPHFHIAETPNLTPVTATECSSHLFSPGSTSALALLPSVVIISFKMTNSLFLIDYFLGQAMNQYYYLYINASSHFALEFALCVAESDLKNFFN